MFGEVVWREVIAKVETVATRFQLFWHNLRNIAKANVECGSSSNSTSGAVALLVAGAWFLWNMCGKIELSSKFATTKPEPKHFLWTNFILGVQALLVQTSPAQPNHVHSYHA